MTRILRGKSSQKSDGIYSEFLKGVSRFVINKKESPIPNATIHIDEINHNVH